VQQADGNPLDGAPRSGGDLGHDEVDDELDEPIAPNTGLDGEDAPDAATVVDAALLDIQDFWREEFEPTFGFPYEELAGGFHPYGPDTELPPCGNPAPRYEDIAANAFYCPSEDLIAWDAVNLIPQLYEEFGGFTLGIVFAHEFGHAIQARADLFHLPTVVTELQADCFAGAWTAHVEAGRSDFFEVTLEDLDKAVAGFLELRDGVGTSAQDPAAHGTGFDRIGAFSDGYESGLERCAEYPDRFADGELVIVEVPFTDPADFERGGNLPLGDLIPTLLTDLEDFWTVLFQEMGETWDPVDDVVPVDPATDEVTCGETYSGDELVGAAFYCVDDDTVYIDAANLIPALNEIGDYAVATEIARQYAYAAQAKLGDLGASATADLQADCFTGIYAASGFVGNREDQSLFLSPGDLDEAVIAFLLRSGEGEEPTDDDTDDAEDDDDTSVSTAFERFDAYRSGFLEGLPACRAISDG
jgi:predicted metalloprotease